MNYYDILGVAKNATPDEIKKSYRKLASQHHPDKGGDTAKFQQIEEAYRTLSDPEKRNQYDNPVPNGAHGFPGGFHFHAQGFDINDLFGKMFRQHQGFSNQVFRTQIQISLEDAYFGNTQQLRLNTPEGNKIVSIDIPKGIKSGFQVKYERLISNAILLVEFIVISNLKYERKENDLYINFPISVLDLIVGTTIQVETISGKKLEVKIPPKTQPYLQFKIAGQGMPIFGTQMYGDQIILFKPFIPDIIPNEISESILRYKKS